MPLVLTLRFRATIHCSLVSIGISCLLVLSGCQAPNYVRSAEACPPPPPPPRCLPTTFSGVGVDTSSAPPKTNYWVLKRVRGADTKAQEFGLVLTKSSSFLILTGNFATDASYVPAMMPSTDMVRLPATSAFRTGKFVATERVPGSVIGDASLFHASASHDDVTIGQSLDSNVNTPILWDGHATVSPDNMWMVYASERLGGLGGTDLWYSSLNGQVAGAVRHCGLLVNTPCDEISPQFSLDGSTLFFSSAGHATVGGYDIFSCSVRRSADSLVFGEPKNLGTPVNSEFDEIFPLRFDDSTMYFGSNRPRDDETRRSDFDVFVLRRESRSTPRTPTIPTPPPPPPPPPPPVVVETATLTGVVINQTTEQPVVDAEVSARRPGDSKIVAQTRTDTVGRYKLEVPVDQPVEITAQSEELFFDGYTVTVPKERARDTILQEKPISLPLTFILRVNFPTSIFDNPYPYTLDSNGMETTKTWQASLDELAGNVQAGINKLRRLVLVGHTDEVDTDASNLRLGRQRVDFIMDQLVQRGVPKDIMEGRSAGERLKLDQRNGEPLDTWRKRLRRVELVKVLR